MCKHNFKRKKYCGGCFVPSHQGLLEKLDTYRLFLCVTQSRYSTMYGALIFETLALKVHDQTMNGNSICYILDPVVIFYHSGWFEL